MFQAACSWFDNLSTDLVFVVCMVILGVIVAWDLATRRWSETS